MCQVSVESDYLCMSHVTDIIELTRTDRKAASDWLLLNDQILTIIYDSVTFSEINNKIE